MGRSMTGVVVTVLFQADAETARRVESEHAETHRKVIELARRHGMRSHRRLYGDGEFIDIDEWDSVEGRQAFLAAAAPLLRELSEARGSAPPVAKIWHEATQHPKKEAPNDGRAQGGQARGELAARQAGHPARRASVGGTEKLIVERVVERTRRRRADAHASRRARGDPDVLEGTAEIWIDGETRPSRRATR